MNSVYFLILLSVALALPKHFQLNKASSIRGAVDLDQSNLIASYALGRVVVKTGLCNAAGKIKVSDQQVRSVTPIVPTNGLLQILSAHARVNPKKRPYTPLIGDLLDDMWGAPRGRYTCVPKAI